MNPFRELEYRILTRISPGGPDNCNATAYIGKSKLAVLLGPDIFDRIRGKLVIDFGCGEGETAVEMASRGARRVIGIDIRADVLQAAVRNAQSSGVEQICEFTTATRETADFIISLDSFEHFSHPDEVLKQMARLLRPDGEVLAAFGPTWLHPLGGHLFSVFPWAHLLFSESALIRWRSTFKTDGATRFSEVAGGLNQLRIAQFEQYVEKSPLRIAALECVPIRRLKPLHNRLTREFTSAIVRAKLKLRG